MLVFTSLFLFTFFEAGALAEPFNFRDYISGLVPLAPLGARDGGRKDAGECKQDSKENLFMLN